VDEVEDDKSPKIYAVMQSNSIGKTLPWSYLTNSCSKVGSLATSSNEEGGGAHDDGPSQSIYTVREYGTGYWKLGPPSGGIGCGHGILPQ
jgi:hypothetical protein